MVTLSHAGAHLGYVCDVGFGLDFLAHWVRDTGHFTLSEGIRKLTIDPAYRFRIPNRGKLQVGALADMLLFNPDEVGIPAVILTADTSPENLKTFGARTSYGESSDLDSEVELVRLSDPGVENRVIFVRLICSS